MKFIDILYETLLKEFRSPSQQFELITLLLMDMALKANTIKQRKSWMIVAALIVKMKSSRVFPSNEEISSIKADVNRTCRDTPPCTAGTLYSVEEIELSERAVKKFLAEHAWEGLPGFGSGEKATTSKVKIRRKQPDLDLYWEKELKNRVDSKNSNPKEPERGEARR